MKFRWEQIFSNEGNSTERAKVFGGWLLRHICWDDNLGDDAPTQSESMVFIPDPNYGWIIGEE